MGRQQQAGRQAGGRQKAGMRKVDKGRPAHRALAQQLPVPKLAVRQVKLGYML
jgi:hypothetical protein